MGIGAFNQSSYDNELTISIDGTPITTNTINTISAYPSTNERITLFKGKIITSGNHTLNISKSGTYDIGHPHIYSVWCNVDQENPILETGQDTPTSKYVDVGNAYLSFGTDYNASVSYPSFYTLIEHANWYLINTAGVYKISEYNDVAYDLNFPNEEDAYFVLQQTEPVPETTDYIMYYSENPKYVELTETTNLQYVYNVCDSFTNYDTLVVNLYDETDTLINQKALTYNDFNQCSGTDTIQFIAGTSENTQNYYIEITNMDTDYSYNTNQFMISEYESIENSNLTFIEPNFNSFQTFDIADTATSTTLNFQYNFCDTSYFNNLTTPKIFLYNENSNNLTSISTNTIDSCGGIINLDFPLATEIIEPQNFSTKLIDDNDNNVYYYEKNNTFQISFYDSSINYEIGDITSTSTIISIFGVNTHDLVCDDSQWNSGNILTTAYCNALKKSIDIPLKFMTWGETKIVQLYNEIKEMPPFNIIFQFQESWQNAEPQLGINKLLGIKTVNAQSTNINDNITVPEIGQGYTFNFPLQDNNVEFKLFNKANMEKYLGTQTLNLIRILGNIALLSLFFLYLYYRIKNFSL
jgi:hypothetical protein